MNKLHLVILQGGGDTDIKLVTPAQWEWIHSPYTGGIEKDPGAPTRGDDGDEDEQCEPTTGSCDNDRALYAESTGHWMFDSTSQAHKWAKKNKFEIADEEYHGYIY